MRRLHSECRVPEADVSLLGAGCPVRCGVRQRRRRVHSAQVTQSAFLLAGCGSMKISEGRERRGPRCCCWLSFIPFAIRMQQPANGAGGMGRMLALASV